MPSHKVLRLIYRLIGSQNALAFFTPIILQEVGTPLLFVFDRLLVSCSQVRLVYLALSQPLHRCNYATAPGLDGVQCSKALPPESLKDIDSSDLSVTAHPPTEVRRASRGTLDCAANFPGLRTVDY